ncbi:hypothetical protein BDW67DRAFT_89709 [Aspergillus spinulosporus]
MNKGPNSATDYIHEKKKNTNTGFPILPVTTYPSRRFKQKRIKRLINYSGNETFFQNALGLRDSTGDGGGGGGYSNTEGDALLLVDVVVAAVPVPAGSAPSRDLAIRAVYMSFWLKVGVITDGARGVDVTAGEVIVLDSSSGGDHVGRGAVDGGWTRQVLLRKSVALQRSVVLRRLVSLVNTQDDLIWV